VNKTVIVYGVGFLLVGLIAVIGAIGAYLTDTWIVEHGGRAVGQITNRRSTSTSDGADYYLEYWFTLPTGEKQEASRGVSRQLWSRVRRGDTLTILYHPEQPDRNFPEGEGVTSLFVLVFIVCLGAVFVGFGGLLIYGGIFPKPTEMDATA